MLSAEDAPKSKLFGLGKVARENFCSSSLSQPPLPSGGRNQKNLVESFTGCRYNVGSGISRCEEADG